jgi:hypothetical protein
VASLGDSENTIKKIEVFSSQAASLGGSENTIKQRVTMVPMNEYGREPY